MRRGGNKIVVSNDSDASGCAGHSDCAGGTVILGDQENQTDLTENRWAFERR